MKRFAAVATLAMAGVFGQTAEVQYVTAGPQTIAPSGQLSVRVRVTNTGGGTWNPLSTFECTSLNLLNSSQCVTYPQQSGAFGLQFIVHPVFNGLPDLNTWWIGHAGLGAPLQEGQTVEISRTLTAENLPVGEYMLLAYMVKNWEYGFGPAGTLYSAQSAFDQAARFPFRVSTDSTPPAIRYSGQLAGSCSLWPPNHKMVEVGTVSAVDLESGVANLNVAVTSPDPTVGPDDYRAIRNPNGSWSVSVRAERPGTGGGREYLISIQASDRAGNTVSTAKSCVIPHDQGH